MRYARYVFVALVLFLTFVIPVYGQEATQEVRPAAMEMKKEAAPEAKQEAREEKREHAKGKEKRVVAAIGADGVQRVEVAGGEYFYDPNYIVVKVNVPVELKVKKTSGYVPHDIVVKAPEAGIDFKTDFGGKEPAVIKFTPTRVGKYLMYCDKKLLFFKSHRDRGMEGMIEVVE